MKSRVRPSVYVKGPADRRLTCPYVSGHSRDHVTSGEWPSPWISWLCALLQHPCNARACVAAADVSFNCCTYCIGFRWLPKVYCLFSFQLPQHCSWWGRRTPELVFRGALTIMVARTLLKEIPVHITSVSSTTKPLATYFGILTSNY